MNKTIKFLCGFALTGALVVSSMTSAFAADTKTIPIVTLGESFTYTVDEPIEMYTMGNINVRYAPSLESEVSRVTDVAEVLYKVADYDEMWSLVKFSEDGGLYFMATEYLTTSKDDAEAEKERRIQKAKEEKARKEAAAAQRSSSQSYSDGGSDNSSSSSSEYSPSYFRRMGVLYWGGYRWTWYSERVLPGGGLNIPGRYSDGTFVRDGEGYICLASNDLGRGTVVSTPFGAGKIYDCGCASGTIDVYVSW